MKKLTASLMVLSMVFMIAAGAFTSSAQITPSGTLTAPSKLLGDVNNDGKVLADDARQILRFSAKLQQSFEKKA